MRIYVGNLSYSVTQEAIEGLFAQHGEGRSLKVNEARPRRESGRGPRW